MAQRLKGQETKMICTGPDGVEQGLIDIKSLNLVVDMEILEEALLGETVNRFDDILNGFGGDFEAQIENRLWMDWIGRMTDRAARRLPAASQFNVTTALALSSGLRPRLLFEDVFWGQTGLRVASRKEYVTIRSEWKCSSMRRIG